MRMRYWRIRHTHVPGYKQRRYQAQYSHDHVTWEPYRSYRTMKEALGIVDWLLTNPLRDGCDEWEPGESWVQLSDAERAHLSAMKQLRGWTATEDAKAAYTPCWHPNGALIGWDFVAQYDERTGPPYAGF